MNEQNLIPIRKGQLTSEEAKKRGRAGGLVRSPAKKWASRLRAMKKKGLTDDNYKRIVAWMEEPESSTLDIFMYLESIKKHCNNSGEMNNLARNLIQLSKQVHGSKDTSQINIQNNVITKINTGLSEEEKEELLRELNNAV